MTIADTIDRLPTDLFINGAWTPAESGRTMTVEDPAFAWSMAEVADAAPADGRRALAAAVAVQPAWQRTAPRHRSEILIEARRIMLACIEDLAVVITSEMGKPLAQARAEVHYAAEYLRWFAEEAVRIAGRQQTTPDGNNRAVVVASAVGPCVLITPWNFPLAMAARKIAPAIAAGCTMVLKPAPQTPLTALLLADILFEAGLPPGVLNVVPTSDAPALIEPLLRSGQVRKLSFTGSTAVGKTLLAQAASGVLRTSMELGGNAPFIVFPDADLDLALEAAMLAKMRNMGETCTAANRFFVHTDVMDHFADRLADAMSALVVGPGLDPATEVGPVIDGTSRDKITRLVTEARERGARTVGTPPEVPGTGYFYPPTVLTDVPADSTICDTEIFGPVAALQPFTDTAEVVAAANRTPWGLAGYLFTENLDTAMAVSDALEVGMVGLNTGLVSDPTTPFGGVKESGLGREGGHVGIDEYLVTKLITSPIRARF
ncbi:NAD-dependent succinate-semialdehyde dehydrogenase [Mycolicibacterium mengxianglii]|uniref:NAD-dependent succinate-semialdehyde dehydrogenase n=1 Tax=Mycolicibacterium mengxianglii TaxID=2736649 RepID=UPI0027DA4AD1|nr:NAD-dependent succinate-semialdehyde dehydrogenase [Mycolicibacterium mengxianglii]